MLRTLDRMIVRELAGPFLFGVAAFTSLFFAGSYLAKLTNLLVEGAPIAVVVQIFFLYFPGVIVLTLPMSTLLAVLLTFARLSSDSEMVALWAGGVSLWRIMRPVLFLALVVALVSYFIGEYAAPQAQRRSTDLRDAALGEAGKVRKPFIITDMKEGRYNAIVIVNGGVDRKTKQLKDVTIISGFDEHGPKVYFSASKAVWEKGDNWKLYDGMMQTFGQAGFTRNEFKEWSTEPVLINRTPEQIIEEQRKAEELTFSELAGRIRRMKDLNLETLGLEVDLYNKLALPFASVVFALIGAPLGLRPARGGSAVGFGLSVGLIFAYWMVWQYMSAIARSGGLDPVAGAFGANIIFSVVGLALLARAAR